MPCGSLNSHPIFHWDLFQPLKLEPHQKHQPSVPWTKCKLCLNIMLFRNMQHCQRIIHVEYAPYETSNIMTQKISQVGIPHNHMTRGKKRLAQKSLNYKHHNKKIPNNLGSHNKVRDMIKFEYHVSIINCCPSTFEHWMLCIRRLLKLFPFWDKKPHAFKTTCTMMCITSRLAVEDGSLPDFFYTSYPTYLWNYKKTSIRTFWK
jgi:hypothetical protein